MAVSTIEELKKLKQLKDEGIISETTYSRLGENLYQRFKSQIDDSCLVKKNKVAAGILALVLGGGGAHKFYLGYYREGLVIALVNIFFSYLDFLLFYDAYITLFRLAMGFFLLAEGLRYLSLSPQDFFNRYVLNKTPWF